MQIQDKILQAKWLLTVLVVVGSSAVWALGWFWYTAVLATVDTRSLVVKLLTNSFGITSLGLSMGRTVYRLVAGGTAWWDLSPIQRLRVLRDKYYLLNKPHGKSFILVDDREAPYVVDMASAKSRMRSRDECTGARSHNLLDASAKAFSRAGTINADQLKSDDAIRKHGSLGRHSYVFESCGSSSGRLPSDEAADDFSAASQYQALFPGGSNDMPTASKCATSLLADLFRNADTMTSSSPVAEVRRNGAEGACMTSYEVDSHICSSYGHCNYDIDSNNVKGAGYVPTTGLSVDDPVTAQSGLEPAICTLLSVWNPMITELNVLRQWYWQWTQHSGDYAAKDVAFDVLEVRCDAMDRAFVKTVGLVG